MNYTRPQLAIALDPIKNAFVQAKNRGVRLRYLTEITSEIYLIEKSSYPPSAS